MVATIVGIVHLLAADGDLQEQGEQAIHDHGPIFGNPKPRQEVSDIRY